VVWLSDDVVVMIRVGPEAVVRDQAALLTLKTAPTRARFAAQASERVRLRVFYNMM